jgi:hypothetical protein
VPVPEPSEVHPEDCSLEQTLVGQPQFELEQLEEVLLLQIALESKRSNVNCNSYILKTIENYKLYI